MLDHLTRLLRASREVEAMLDQATACAMFVENARARSCVADALGKAAGLADALRAFLDEPQGDAQVIEIRDRAAGRSFEVVARRHDPNRRVPAELIERDQHGAEIRRHHTYDAKHAAIEAFEGLRGETVLTVHT